MPYKLIPPRHRGAYWYVRGTVNGSRFEASTRTTDRKRAERWAARYVAELARDPVPGREGQPVTFRQAADAFIGFKNPAKPDRQWIDRLSGYLGAREISTITHAHLVEAANSLLPGRANTTKNRQVIGPAAAILHYAAEQGWCPYRRFKLFPVPKRSPREPVSDDTMSLLIANTEGAKRLLLALLYETGLRITDTLRLRGKDLDLRRGQIRVKIHKTDERAAIDVSPALVAMLANIDARGASPVLPWRSRWQVYRWLRPLCKKLGVRYTPHQSRHALATWLLEQGVPDRAAMEAGAWADERSLHRYQHVRTSGLPRRSVAGLKAGTK